MNTNNLRSMQSATRSPVPSVLQSLETPLHSGNKRKVLDTIEKLGLKVTPGTVAAESGLPVLVCTALLNQIAYETQGQLQVDNAGQITYQFPPAFQMNYVAGAYKDAFKTAYRVALNAIAILVRVATGLLITVTRATIGAALILSVVLVVVLVVVLIVLLIVVSIARFFDIFSGGDSGGGDVGDVGSGLNMDWLGSVRWFAFDWIWDWYTWDWFYSPYGSWYDWSPSRSSYGTAYGGTPSIGADFKYDAAASASKPGNSFIDCCCAMLLGVGDPNQQLREQQWSLIARVIKAKGGVIVADDLAPYMETGNRPNEDWVLPALIRFNGTPEVTPGGKLVYCFPTLVPETVLPSRSGATGEQLAKGEVQLTHDQLNNLVSSHLNRTAHQLAQADQLPAYLEMKRIPVCGLEDVDVMKVIGFAGIASGGAISLLCLAPTMALIHYLQPWLWGIAAYGGLFFFAPLVRACLIMPENESIAAGNARRQDAALRLQNPDGELASKLQEAEAIRSEFWQSSTGVAYTTEKDVLEQQYNV